MTTASQSSITFGEESARIKYIHRYASTDEAAVMEKTPSSAILRVSPAGIATMHTAMMMSCAPPRAGAERVSVANVLSLLMIYSAWEGERSARG